MFLECQNVGLYTIRGGGLKKCTVCTLLKMLTFLGGPLNVYAYMCFTCVADACVLHNYVLHI